MRGVRTNTEGAQLLKPVWQSLVQRSLARVCDRFEVWTCTQTGTCSTWSHQKWWLGPPSLFECNWGICNRSLVSIGETVEHDSPYAILACVTFENHWEARIVMHQHMWGGEGFLCLVGGLFTLARPPELLIFLKELVEWLKNWAQIADELPVVVDHSKEGS